MASARAEMTLPSVVRLLLMLAPSFSRVPFAPVDSARSDPARSTSEILLTFSAVSPDAYEVNYELGLSIVSPMIFRI